VTPEVEVGQRLAEAISAAEPEGSRRLGELIERLEAEGRLRTVKMPEPAAESGSGLAAGSLPIRGVSFDSRRVRAGCVFVAVPGEHVDGHDYVPAAIALGAAAAIVERPLPAAGVPQIVVDRSQAALATAAAWWYGDPSRELAVVGVTGTDGKTTTSFLATAVLEAGGISAGLLTTAEIKVGELRGANPEHVTTPQAPQLQKSLRAMVRAGNRAAIVETTSHGLALGRVAGIAYDSAVFTNLTHEHLELHGTFEAYREAKLGLFRRLGGPPKPAVPFAPRVAIVNCDDASAPLFEAAATEAGVTVLRYGVGPQADVRALDVSDAGGRPRFTVQTPGWRSEIALRMVGRFNVSNALAAIALGEAFGLDPAVVREAVAGMPGVPGRMELVELGQPFRVVVDYAHSPASLTTVLDQLAPLAAGSGGLIVVFGSAGERDVQKRPMMGRIAGERSRLVVVTDEDPRGEDRYAILDEIAAGAEAAGRRRGDDLLLIADRREAIEAAFGRARPGDVVLLAGKGHEQSIIMADGPRAWDEKSEALAALTRMGYSGWPVPPGRGESRSAQTE
jgi:UDP-N-acetylmuramoyl-L-alanyl-D-glutamate--2,6-diaminopimelate ligase